jgi:hypothetical protein
MIDDVIMTPPPHAPYLRQWETRLTRERGGFGARALRLAGMTCLAAALTATVVAAQTAPPTAAAQAFERFLRSSAPICIGQPSPVCVAEGWDYADIDSDGGLSIQELAVVERAVRDWYDWRADDIPGRDRLLMALGLWVLGQVGLENLAASYDADGDGLIAREELLADVRLDDRPLGQVLRDTDAVNRGAIARRLGAFAPVLGTFLE